MDEELATKLYYEGYVDKKIAEAIGSNQPAVCRWRHRNGLPCNGIKKYNKLHEKLLECYNKGMNDGETARELKIHRHNVYTWRKKENLPTNDSCAATKELNNKMLKEYEAAPEDKPWSDPESLFCDKRFLESFVKKRLT